MSEFIGQTLGEYRLEALLGTGSIGQVYRAIHVFDDHPAAVKVCHATVTAEPGFQARFWQTAEAVRSLNHPNIAKIYDVGEHMRRLYLIMEFVAGGSLRRVFSQPASAGLGWSLGARVELVRQTAEGLALAHSQGVVHGDIKPENILLTTSTPGQSTVRITDFGLVRLAESDMIMRGASLSTPVYMSPEHCQGLELDGRSDVYSLGVVLYEVATDYVPFDAKTLSEAVQKHVYVPPPPPHQVRPGLPASLETTILRCLAKNPNDRFASAAEVAAALQGVIPRETPTPEPPNNAVTPPRESPRPPPRGERIGVAVDPKALTVMPDQPVECTVMLVNAGPIVDGFTVTVEGVPAEWVHGARDIVRLNPNAQAEVRLTVQVPKVPASHTGDYRVTIRARSGAQPEEAGTADAVWTVLPFAATDLRVTPAKASGRTGALYRVTLRNEGNAPVRYTLRGSDEEEKLRYEFEPDQATPQPLAGQAKTALLSGTSMGSEQQLGDPLATQLAEVKNQNELGRIDYEWEIERKHYLIPDRYGGKHVPTAGMGIRGAVVAGVFGVLCTIMAIFKITWSFPPRFKMRPTSQLLSNQLFFLLLGVVITVAAIGYGVYFFLKAQKYQEAFKAYEARRAQVKPELEELRRSGALSDAVCTVEVAPGEAPSIRLQVRPQRLRIFGKTQPFSLRVQAVPQGSAEAHVAVAQFSQQALIPLWVGVVILLALVVGWQILR